VWALSERVFSAAFPAATAGQKIFWGLAIIFVVTIFAESVQLLYRVEQRIEETSVVFNYIGDADVEKDFKEIHKWYYRDFRKIRRWVRKTIKAFHDDMENGYIYMLPESARDDMAEMYRTAKEWVATTNVGTSTFFLENENYQRLNLQTFGRGVPVIRFFLCVLTPQALARQDIFFDVRDSVKESMRRMNTVCGVLINADNAPTTVPGLLGVQDFLLVDDSFVAHAELKPPGLEIRRIRATIRKDNIDTYRQYLRRLGATIPRELIGLDEINDANFRGREILARRMGRRTGREIFNDIMNRI
jgi:hypothetical protein